jgi:hypothetical protein
MWPLPFEALFLEFQNVYHGRIPFWETRIGWYAFWNDIVSFDSKRGAVNKQK